MSTSQNSSSAMPSEKKKKSKKKKAAAAVAPDVQKKVKAAKTVRAMAQSKVLRNKGTAWTFFCRDQAAVADNMGERSKILSEKWQKLTDEQKRPWVEKQEADKLRYDREAKALPPLDVMEPSMKAAVLKNKRLCRMLRKQNRPKMALSAYMFFVKTQRHQFEQKYLAQPGASAKSKSEIFNDIGRDMGAVWKTMTTEEKGPYQQMHETEKTRYAAEVAEQTAQANARV